MSKYTTIQWTDSTSNPVMGCEGCPLWPGREKFVAEAAKLLLDCATGLDLVQLRTRLHKIWNETLDPSRVRHVPLFLEAAVAEFAPHVPQGEMAKLSAGLLLLLRCYAGKVTHVWGGGGNSGFPVSFDTPVLYPGRMALAAAWNAVSPAARRDKPWLAGCRRLIFVSDMGDALSTTVPFEYLEQEIVQVTASDAGQKHIWLWLTKRPERLSEFYRWLKARGVAWPSNVIPMSSILNAAYARKALHLLEIPAAVHGYSVEPLDAPLVLPAELISAKPWIILGGESGSAAALHPFDLAWARSIRDQCAAARAPFFMKQLGGSAFQDGVKLELRDRHGGEWDEWPKDLRIRQVPGAFRSTA